jgi:antibiotic biosynthesis monooxygenase (ABM) superfamily enzyme
VSGTTARVLLTVVATVEPAHERAFNRWYDEEHAPQMLRQPGCLRAGRYRNLDEDAAERYIAVYEFADRASYDAFQASAEKPRLVAEYDEAFGATSTRVATGYVEVWSPPGG